MLVAKKTPISITIDADVLRALDGMLRELQEKELRGRKKLSNRSMLIERMVTDYMSRRGSDR